MKRRYITGYCALCGVHRISLHRDHIVPKFKGGSDGEANIQYICANCHEDKTREERIGVSIATPETRRRMSDSAIRHRAEPGVKEKIRADTLSRWQEDEFRLKIREKKQLSSRITPQGVRVIRQMRAAGKSQQAIADHLSITREQVRGVLNGKQYTWVE